MLTEFRKFSIGLGFDIFVNFTYKGGHKDEPE